MTKPFTVRPDEVLREVCERMKGRLSLNAYVLDLIEKDGRKGGHINAQGELNPRPGEWPVTKER